jgi:cohesin loading factor subunit SCC2
VKKAILPPILTQLTGFLFRAYPTLMTHESSSQLMDQIFSSEDEEAKARLLKILQDFLSSESAKHSAQEKGMHPCIVLHLSDNRTAASANKKASKGVDMEAFVGNTHGFAESG